MRCNGAGCEGCKWQGSELNRPNVVPIDVPTFEPFTKQHALDHARHHAFFINKPVEPEPAAYVAPTSGLPAPAAGLTPNHVPAATAEDANLNAAIAKAYEHTPSLVFLSFFLEQGMFATTAP